MKERFLNTLYFFILSVLSILFIFPVFVVVINSLKYKFSIATTPFVLPNAETFSGSENYITGIETTGFPQALGWSLFITVFSVVVIIVFTSMTAWYITRVTPSFTMLWFFQ